MVLLQIPPGLHYPAPDIGRQARAEVNELNGRLLASSSATETLRRWCADHGLATPAAIRAIRVRGKGAPPSRRVLGLLRVRSAKEVRYRRVDLACGAHVLSRAENWYVPGRLTVEMNHRLASTEAPFGAVVSPLGFHRRTLEAQIPPAPASADVVLRHVAVLTTAAGVPFSVVAERYTRAMLAGPSPVTPPRR